jgi:hypothetical protein
MRHHPHLTVKKKGINKQLLVETSGGRLRAEGQKQMHCRMCVHMECRVRGV